jgi:hypothetical protein
MGKSIDTGTLRSSITYEVDEDKLVGYVGSNLKDPPYGAYLEFGTSRMKPRPWLKPAKMNKVEFILIAICCGGLIFAGVTVVQVAKVPAMVAGILGAISAFIIYNTTIAKK